jgi:hypothetical protein
MHTFIARRCEQSSDDLMKRLKIFLLLLPSLLVQCTVDSKTNISETFISDREWKFGKGYHIGDHLRFDSLNYRISNDTIFRNDSATAVIAKILKATAGHAGQIEIHSITTQEKGTYHEL